MLTWSHRRQYKQIIGNMKGIDQESYCFSRIMLLVFIALFTGGDKLGR